MKPSSLSVLILSCVILGGCASTSERERIAPGPVALVAAHYAPAADFNAYASGRGANAVRQAGESARKGAGIAGFVPAAATQVVGRVAPPLALFGAIVTVAAAAAGGVVGGAVGLIDGAVNGMDSDQINAIHKPIERARADAALQSAMSQQVLALAVDLPDHQLTYLPELGPASPRQTPDYQVLKAAGFESVLELAVTSIGFEAAQAEPPTAMFGMTLRARAVPLSTDVKPWMRERTYQGTPRTVPEWQADDGQLFQQELDAAYRSLAQFVYESMFGWSPADAPAPADPEVAPIALQSPSIPDPTATRSPAPAAGDTWTYLVKDPKRRHRQGETHQVTILSVSGDALVEQVAGENRQAAQTLHLKGGYLVRQGAVSLFSPYLTASGSLEPGAQIAKTENLDSNFCSPQWICLITARVVGKEMVRVPAGEFEAVKVEVEHAWMGRTRGGGARTLTIWYAPETKRAVKFSSRGSFGQDIQSDFDLELASYHLN